MTRWSSILGQHEAKPPKRRNSSWLSVHGRNQRSLDLKEFMRVNGLSVEDVGLILNRSPKTVKYWLIGGERNIPVASMSLLRMKVASTKLEQEIISYQKRNIDIKNQLASHDLIG